MVFGFYAKKVETKKRGDAMSSLAEKPYYKWIVAGLMGLLAFVAVGFSANIAGLYLKTVTEDLQIERGLYSLMNLFRYGACALLNASFAFLVGKLGAKKLLVLSLSVLVASQLAYSFAQGLPMIYLGGLLLGFGFNSFCATITGYIIGRWFTEGRGTVLGVVFSTTGAGCALATMLLRPVITGEAQIFGFTGWRTSYRIVAALVAALIVLVLLLYRNASIPAGVVPDGGHKKRGMVWDGIDWSIVRKERLFYLLCVGVFLSGSVIQGVYGVATAHLEDVQLNSAYITAIVTVSSVVLCLAKILVGFCYDRLGLPLTVLFCHVSGVLGMGLLAFVSKAAPGFGLAYEVLSPFALTQETVLLALIASDLFGERSNAKALGILVSISAVGYAASAFLLNRLYDRLGSYQLILIGSAVLLAAATILMQIEIRRGEKERDAILARENAEGED